MARRPPTSLNSYVQHFGNTDIVPVDAEHYVSPDVSSGTVEMFKPNLLISFNMVDG